MKVGIFYFSGTGNTEAVVKLTEKAFGHYGKEYYKRHGYNAKVEVEVNRIEDIVKTYENHNIQPKIIPANIIEKYDLIGIAAPVYAMGITTLVEKFIAILPKVDGDKKYKKPVFIITTAGEESRINEFAANKITRKLQRKNYNVVYNTMIQMPSNWHTTASDEGKRKIYEEAKRKVKKTVLDILYSKKKHFKKNFLLEKTMEVIAYTEEKYGAKSFGRSLFANENCTQCGKCIRECPKGNINFEEHKEEAEFNLAFYDECIMCMRCVYGCPTNAIHTKSKVHNKWILKDGYCVKTFLAD